MNISRESTGDLTATVKIEINQEDYADKVSNALKEVQKTANLKGFRPGKVPFGLIKKMYGKGALAEEVNKILSESLNNYIIEEKLEILGYPLASEKNETKADFDNDENFEFFFDLGLAPQIELELNDNIEVDYFEITVSEEQIDGYLKEVQQRHGSPVEAEEVKAGDLLRGEFKQLNDEGEIIPDGVIQTNSFAVDFIKDEKLKKELTGKSKGYVTKFSPLKATENEVETASLLGIKKEEKEKLEATYEFTLNEISRVEPAEVNEELFKKVYPVEDIKTEEDFRKRLAKEASSYYQKESENYLVHSIMDKLIHDTSIELPDEFLKRWRIESNENKEATVTNEDYEQFANSLKQQIIIQKIAKDHEIKVEHEDVKEQVKKSFLQYYNFNAENEDQTKQVDSIVDSLLQNKEEYNKVYDQLFDEKVREVFKNTVKLNNQSVTYEEFIKKAEEHHKHHHHHEHE